jgi:hypothetical protein
MNQFPVNFETLAQLGGNPAAGGYPYQIKGADLMRDFVFAALDADASLIDDTLGQFGYPQRKLKIPALPGSGTYVLGSTDGVLSWIETEACDAEPEE